MRLRQIYTFLACWLSSASEEFSKSAVCRLSCHSYQSCALFLLVRCNVKGRVEDVWMFSWRAVPGEANPEDGLKCCQLYLFDLGLLVWVASLLPGRQVHHLMSDVEADGNSYSATLWHAYACTHVYTTHTHTSTHTHTQTHTKTHTNRPTHMCTHTNRAHG